MQGFCREAVRVSIQRFLGFCREAVRVLIQRFLGFASSDGKLQATRPLAVQLLVFFLGFPEGEASLFPPFLQERRGFRV
jgi:hypothetical protein